MATAQTCQGKQPAFDPAGVDGGGLIRNAFRGTLWNLEHRLDRPYDALVAGVGETGRGDTSPRAETGIRVTDIG